VKTGARGGGLRELKSGIRLVRDRDDVPCPFVDILREPDSHHGSHTDRWIKAKARTWKTELIATSTAAASRSPQARSFQMRTIAMQRAKPTMISPVRYSGRSGRNSHASANMNAGAANQLMTRDVIISFLSAST
jgi:hypothetical protein